MVIMSATHDFVLGPRAGRAVAGSPEAICASQTGRSLCAAERDTGRAVSRGGGMVGARRVKMPHTGARA
jgi:hypothetical protein